MMCFGRCLFLYHRFFLGFKKTAPELEDAGLLQQIQVVTPHINPNSYSKGSQPKKTTLNISMSFAPNGVVPSSQKKITPEAPVDFPTPPNASAGGGSVVEKKLGIKHGTEQETAMQNLYIFQHFPFRKAVNGS